MHASGRRTAVIVIALTFLASPAAAAEKPAKASSQTTAASATVASDAKVNVNTASAKDLTALSGVSPRIAERIVAYREANGPFKKPEDLRRVDGVGKAMWERNRDRVVVK